MRNQVSNQSKPRSSKHSRRVFVCIVLLCSLLLHNVFGQSPTITAFTPVIGFVGTTVTITGTNFNTTAPNNVVYFGATRATVTAATATQLTVTVPTGAKYASITVLNISSGLQAFSTTNFIPAFSPNKGSITPSDFNPKTDFATGSSPYSVSIGDLDSDGKADLVVTNSSSNTISVFRNTSTGPSFISYAAKVDFTTDSEPTSVAIGDLDGDGKNDLAVTNYTSNTISIFMNTSTGVGSISYASKIDFTTGTQPISISIGDLDGDGRADLAVTNYSNSTLSIFRNKSTGIGVISYATKDDFSTGTSPRSASIGDLDGDGKADLAVANEISNTVSIFRNISTGPSNIGFDIKIDFPTGSAPTSISTGDLDSDGKADLAVANRFSSTVSILRNTSTGAGNIGFDAKIDFSSGSIPRAVSISDLDGDGKPDLAVANQNSNTVSVLRNTSIAVGAISYAVKVDFPSGLYPRSVSIGDMDGDGKAELVVANRDENSLSILRNNPIFSVPTITSFTPTSGPTGTTVTITGTNFSTTPANNIVYFGATRATVTVATATQLTVTVPTGATYQPITVQVVGLIAYSSKQFLPIFSGGGLIDACSFAPKVDIATDFNPLGIAINDFDGDGKGDIAITNRGSNLLSIYRNVSTSGVLNSSSLSTPINLATLDQPWSATAGDIDGDGKLDLVVANAQSAAISVYRNTSTSGSLSFDNKVDFATGLDPWKTAIADFDGDGKPEIIVSNRFSNSVSVYKNTSSSGSFSTSTFAAPVNFSTGTEPYDVAIGDVNGDSKPDIIALNNISNSVSVFQNTTSLGVINSSSFAAKVDFPTSSSPYGLALADVDGDSKLDILASNNFAFSTISILQNVSGGTINSSSFSPKVDFAVGSTPNHFGLADFDGDGKLDLAVTNSGSDAFTLFKNTSAVGSITSASFAAGINIPTGANPAGITAGDIDGDGRPEIVVGNFVGGSLSIYQNLVGLINPPTIASFAPLSGPIGSSVTITGINFNTPFINAVKINGIPAIITASTATTLTVTVPVGATTGPIEVSIGCNTVTSASNFTVPAPVTITISPQPISTAVCDGATASFTLASSGTTNLAYQWQKISSEAASLSGLRWNIPSIADLPDGISATAIDPAPVIAVMGGVSGTTYSVAMRFRGVVETKTYLGGTTTGFWNANGTPTSTAYNIYELRISDPPGIYYLNAGVENLYCIAMDYQQTISIKSGANVELRAFTIENAILKNKDQFGNPIIIPGISPAPSAFDGQFIQMDVVAINGVGYADVTDGGGISGATSPTLTVNTTGNFGAADYRCKVSGDLASDIFSNAVTLTVNPLPNPPTPINNSGCSGTDISIAASGGANGQYRWYTTSTGGTAIAGQTNDIYIPTPALTTTTSFWAAINNGTCESTRTEVVATMLPLPPTPTVSPAAAVCAGSNITLSASGTTNGNYRWYDGANVIIGQVNSQLLVTNLTSNKTFQASIFDGTCESSKANANASVKNCTAPAVASTTATAFIEGEVKIDLRPLISDPENDLDESTLQVISISSGAPFSLSGMVLSINYAGFPFTGTDVINLSVCDLTSLCTTQTVAIELGGNITVYNAISPNGDNKNPTFQIQYIDILPETKNNKVMIFNRWGDVVFEVENYDNTNRVFRGLDNSGDALPPGTYYYKIKFANGGSEKTGFIALRK